MVGVGCCFATFPFWEGTSGGWRGKGQDRSCDIKLGAVLRGDLDGLDSSREKGYVDCRLAAYLKIRSVGFAYSRYRD